MRSGQRHAWVQAWEGPHACHEAETGPVQEKSRRERFRRRLPSWVGPSAALGSHSPRLPEDKSAAHYLCELSSQGLCISVFLRTLCFVSELRCHSNSIGRWRVTSIPDVRLLHHSGIVPDAVCSLSRCNLLGYNIIRGHRSTGVCVFRDNKVKASLDVRARDDEREERILTRTRAKIVTQSPHTN